MAVSIDPATKAVRNAFFGVPSPNMSWLSGGSEGVLILTVFISAVSFFQIQIDHVAADFVSIILNRLENFLRMVWLI